MTAAAARVCRRVRARRLQQGDDLHVGGPRADPAHEPEHEPANRRASLEWAHRLRGQLDGGEGWQAWYLLFVSILAVVTQICLRIVHDGRPPPAAVAVRSAPEASKTQEPDVPAVDGAPGLVHRLLRWKPQGQVVSELPGAGASTSLAALPTGCSQYDELCHSRMLYYADAVSYDHDTSLFYTVLKDWVLYLIFMASLYSFSYVGLRRYQRRRWTSATALRRDAPSPPLSPRAPLRRTWAEDDAALLEDDGVPFALCALSVAVALGSVLLVPMTVLDGLLRKHLSSEDLYGGLTAHTDLGLIWQNLFYVSTFCHLLVLPFAFLYTESEGLGRTAGTIAGRKVLSRLRETSVTLVLVLALVALLVQVLEMLQVPLMQQQRLTLSYIVTAMLGSLIFLVLVPFGFEGYICLAIRHAQRTFTAASDTQEELDTQELEWESFLWAAWRQQRQPKPKPKPRHSCTFPLPPPPHYSPPAPPDHSPRGLRASTTFEDKLGGGAWARRVAGMCGVGQAVVSHVASLVLVVASLVLPATVLVRVVVCQVLCMCACVCVRVVCMYVSMAPAAPPGKRRC